MLKKSTVFSLVFASILLPAALTLAEEADTDCPDPTASASAVAQAYSANKDAGTAGKDASAKAKTDAENDAGAAAILGLPETCPQPDASANYTCGANGIVTTVNADESGPGNADGTHSDPLILASDAAGFLDALRIIFDKDIPPAFSEDTTEAAKWGKFNGGKDRDGNPNGYVAVATYHAQVEAKLQCKYIPKVQKH